MTNKFYPPLPSFSNNRWSRIEWGEITLREFLAAFANQFDGKIQQVKKWKETFRENWLLLHVGSGGPFGGLVAARPNAAAGRTTVVP